ncbi:amidohydrolase family-domain-containing protein [Amanita rubescens]|nr:amidohydrolase family-domain-containing protein [Amanita rubescens]
MEKKSPQPPVAISWKALLALVLLACLSYPNLLDSRRSTYALCSSEGNKIYTVDKHDTTAQCIVIRKNRIVDVGSLRSITSHWGYSSLYRFITRSSLDVRYIPRDATIVPGFSDSHAHILEYGYAKELPLDRTKNVEETVARVRDFILANPDVLNDTSKYIIGGGWDHTIWPASNLPTAADLEADPVVRGRPIILNSKDWHAIWVSSKVLEDNSPLPETVEGGVIVREDDGRPTGVLLDNAQQLIEQPGPTHDDRFRQFRLTMTHAMSYGLTSIHDAGLNPQSMEFFEKLAAENALPLRIYGMRYFDENEPEAGYTIPKVARKRLTARSIKIFADGALRSGGAALFEPYADNPSTRGFMRIDLDLLHDVIPKYLQHGWQVNVHAIGDRANSIVLDAFEAALDTANVTALRPRLEHAQILSQKDMRRLGKLGVIVSVQPTHVIEDMWFAEDRLGPDRVKGLYAFRSIIDSGALITLGSDFPVASANPLKTFYTAITRLSYDGNSPHGPGGWFPEQRLTRNEALRGLTLNPAYASFTEDILGSLEIGKLADFVILSHDIMSIPATEILNTRVLATVVDGELVYGSMPGAADQ